MREELSIAIAGGPAFDMRGERAGEDPAAGMLDAFSADLYRRYQAARDARRLKMEQEMLSDARRRDGEYDPDELAKLRNAPGGAEPEVFDNITDAKCSGIESQLADILFFAGSEPFGLKPTPVPELDERVEMEATRRVMTELERRGAELVNTGENELDAMLADARDAVRRELEGEADKRAARMEKIVNDQLAEGGWREAMNDFLTDFATHKFACLMGPLPRIRRKVKVVGGQVVFQDREVLEVECVSPLDVYPAALSRRPEDGDFFVRRRIGEDAALELANDPWIDIAQFDQALRRKGAGVDEPVDVAVASLGNKVALGGTATEPDGAHELIYWWRRVTRADAKRWMGLPEADTPEERVADAEHIPMMGLLLNGVCIKAVPNWDETGRPQVFVASFRKRPGSFYGQGGSGLAKGQQAQVNGIARALTKNIHFSAAPTLVADETKLANRKALSVRYPNQIIAVRTQPGDTRDPVHSLDVPNYTQMMLAARNQAASWLDAKTGVFPQGMGDPKQYGAAQTFGGLQLLTEKQTAAIKRALYNISEAVAGLYREFWLWNMLFGEDESAKGDVEVVTQGAVQLYLTSEDTSQALELLRLIREIPALQAGMLPEGAVYLARELLRRSRIDADKVFYQLEEAADRVRRQEEEAKAQQKAAIEAQTPKPDESKTVKAEADLIKAQATADRVSLERQRTVGENAERVMRIRRMMRENRRDDEDRAAARMAAMGGMTA